MAKKSRVSILHKPVNPKKFLLLTILGCLLIVLLMGTIFYKTSAQWRTISYKVPNGYFLYKDPDGYFTISVPNSWSIKRDRGYVRSSSKGRELDYPEVYTSFSSDPDYSHRDSADVGIRVDERITDCNLVYKEGYISQQKNNNTTLSGVPAEYISREGWLIWLIDTKTAYFQVSTSVWRYPHGLLRPPSPTPPPVSIISDHKKIVDKMIKSFTILHPETVKCNLGIFLLSPQKG